MANGNGDRQNVLREWAAPVLMGVAVTVLGMMYADFRDVVKTVEVHDRKLEVIQATRWTRQDHETWKGLEFRPLERQVQAHQKDGKHLPATGP